MHALLCVVMHSFCECEQANVRFMVWIIGKMAQDVGQVLWCHSHLVRLVFEGSIPTTTYFHPESFFVTCSFVFSLFMFKTE